MASSRLNYDSATVQSLWQDLTVVKQEFDGATVNAAVVAAAVGNGALADRIRSFADRWDDTRADLSEQIGQLADAALTMNNGFDDVERGLVQSLTGAGE